MPSDAGSAKNIFLAAIELPDASERSAFLDRQCAGSADLRRRVEALLRAHEDPASVLDAPLAGLDADTQIMSPASPKPLIGSFAVGTLIGGRYKLLERIGEGGMGEVWVADQLTPISRRVAMKLIKPGLDSRAILARFDAERQALALMDHPNIARVLDAGAHDDGRPWFAMELVKGTPITEFCDARRLTPTQRLDLLIPVCHAIQHAHQKGIIHRDIKPGNVLVELHDDRMVPKVIDFGVAKAVAQPLTEKTLYTGYGTLIGTPTYMAPEQAAFNAVDIDTRADVYALGVLLYELLAGSPPVEPARFREAALDEVLRLVREEEPPRPSDRLSTSSAKASIAAVRQSDPARLAKLVRGDLDWIVMKALEKDRARRYETAAAFARDIERYLGDEPVEARAPSLVYRVRKALVRHRVVAASVALISAAVLLGALVSTWQAVRAVRARQDEQRARAVAEDARQRAVDLEADARRERDNAVDARSRLETSQEQILADAYMWDMQMIPLAWEGGNVARARDMLARHVPAAGGPADRRGFEWHYWNGRIHGQRRSLQLPGRPASAPGWAMSDDATLVLTIVTVPASAPQSQPATSPAAPPAQVLKVFDAATGREVLSHLLEATPGRAHLGSVRFTRDNRRLAISWGTERRAVTPGNPDNGMTLRRVRIVDLPDGKTRLDYREPDRDVERWNLSADGRRFAVTVRGSRFGAPATTKVFDVDAGDVLFAATGEADGECSPPISHDGSRLAVALVSRDASEVRVCDTTTGKVISSWKFNADAAPLLAFSPDGNRLSGVFRHGGDKAIWSLRMWDVDGGKVLFSATPPQAVSGRTTQFRQFFNVDGSRLAVVGRSQGLTRGPETKVLDTQTGAELFTVTGRHAQDTHAFTPDGKHIVTSEGAALAVRDATSMLLELVRGHATRVVAFAITPDGRLLRSIEEDGTLKEWDLKPVDPIALTAPDRAGISATAFSADGSTFAALIPDPADSAALSIGVVQTETGRMLRNWTVPPRAIPARTSDLLAFSGDGSRVAVIRSGRDLSRFGTPVPARAGQPAQLIAWDARSGSKVAEIDLGTNLIQALALSDDGTRVAIVAGTAGDSPELKLLDLGTAKSLQAINTAPMAGAIAWSPDGRCVAGVVKLRMVDAWTAAATGLRVWDVTTGKEVHAMTLAGEQPTIAWSADGKMIAAGFKDFEGQAVVQVFDALTGKVRLTLSDPAGIAGNRTPSGLAFSNDGRRLAAHLGGPMFVNRAESEVKIWETSGGREMLSLKSSTPAKAVLAFATDGAWLAEAGQPVAGVGRSLPGRGLTLHVWRAAPSRENP